MLKGSSGVDPLRGQEGLTSHESKVDPFGSSEVDPNTVSQDSKKQQQGAPGGSRKNGQSNSGPTKLGKAVVGSFDNSKNKQTQNGKLNQENRDLVKQLIGLKMLAHTANQVIREFEPERIREAIRWATDPENGRDNIPGSIHDALYKGWLLTTKRRSGQVRSQYNEEQRKKVRAIRLTLQQALQNPRPPEEIAEDLMQ